MRLAFVCILAAAAVSGCEPRIEKTYACYGDSVFVTNARWKREVEIAVVQVHDAMANWMVKSDGRKSDPTYKAQSRNVQDSRSGDCSISRLEFTTADGHVNTIQTICISERDIILILCESTADDARRSLRDGVAAALDARGLCGED